MTAMGSLDDMAQILPSIEIPESITAEHDVACRQSLRIALRGLSHLPERLRIAAVLRFLLDESYEDIARELGVSVTLVRKRIQEARDVLKRTALI